MGADGNSFQYRRGGAAGAGGAEATITCHKAKKGGCNGEARDAEGNAFVLEFCGAQGHVWKQPNMKLFSDHGKKKVRRGGVQCGSGMILFKIQNNIFQLIQDLDPTLKTGASRSTV